MIRPVHHFMDMDPNMKTRSIQKRKNPFHHLFAQFVHSLHRYLMSGQMIIFRLFLDMNHRVTFSMIRLLSIFPQCFLRHFGNSPDIEQVLFSRKLINPPQRHSQCLSGWTIPKSNEVFVDDVLRECSYRIEGKRNLQMLRNGRQ